MGWGWRWGGDFGGVLCVILGVEDVYVGAVSLWSRNWWWLGWNIEGRGWEMRCMGCRVAASLCEFGDREGVGILREGYVCDAWS